MAKSSISELKTAIQKSLIEIGEMGDEEITTEGVLKSLRLNSGAKISSAASELIEIGLARTISQVLQRGASNSFDNRVGLHGEVFGIAQTIVLPKPGGGTRRILFKRATLADLKSHLKAFGKKRGISKENKKIQKFLAWAKRNKLPDETVTAKALAINSAMQK
jgi:hypothetical protein